MKELLHSSTIRLQELRRALEKDHGQGAACTVIVQDEKGEVLQFISHTSAPELAESLKKYAQRLGS